MGDGDGSSGWHSFDFRDCGEFVQDSQSELRAQLCAGARSSAEGVVLDGAGAHVRLDPWKFGGDVSVEVYLKVNSSSSWTAIFDAGNGMDMTRRSNCVHTLGCKEVKEH